jgi:hypothetical protein
MYPEEVYTLYWALPRELSRPIAFNLARGLIQDKLRFPRQIRVLEIEGYESHYIVCKNICWWITIEDGVLHSILMSDFQCVNGFKETGGYKYMYLK